MNGRRLAVVLSAFAVFLLPACQQEMAVQPSGRPDEASTFFPQGREDQPLVSGTVARGHLRTDLDMYTGERRQAPEPWRIAASLIGGAAGGDVLGGLAVWNESEANDVTEFPFPVTAEVLEQGRDRFMIYCVVCHDPLGTGRGKIVERGYTQPPSYHIDRLRAAPVGHFFRVITEGYGSMPDYKQQVPPRDRWAIAAYIRALQLSQHFPKAEWDKQDQAGGRPQ